MTSRFLIINAGNFGYNNAITRRILNGYREGLPTITSDIASVPGVPERIAAANANDRGLPIGPHLTTPPSLSLSEIVVHPALEYVDLHTMEERYHAERARELAELLDPRACSEVDRPNIHVTNFSSFHRGFIHS